MRFRTVFTFSSLSVLLLALSYTAWSVPVFTQPTRVVAPTPETESISGKISSVGDAQFSLDIVKNQKPNTLQFLVDSNTKVEGKLTVGAQAAVDYRTDGDRLIATHIVVMPPSGSSSH
jgi:hypothetical protein